MSIRHTCGLFLCFTMKVRIREVSRMLRETFNHIETLAMLSQQYSELREPLALPVRKWTLASCSLPVCQQQPTAEQHPCPFQLMGNWLEPLLSRRGSEVRRQRGGKDWKKSFQRKHGLTMVRESGSSTPQPGWRVIWKTRHIKVLLISWLSRQLI